MHITKHGGLGWKRDTPDLRDLHFSVPSHLVGALPAYVDLRPGLPAPLPFDQGQLGSCTSQAIAAALMYDQHKQNETVTTPSRLMIYYLERVIEGTIKSDSGAEIRDGIKAVNQQGACPETEWPYDIGKFTRKPSKKCYTDALKYEALTYQRVGQTLPEMQGCLAAGLPFVIGISVYASFESQTVATTGVVPMPKQGEQLLGGHALLCCGYSNDTQRFTVLNSWSAGFGDKGYVYLPYQYLTDTNLGGDFWTIQSVR
jgi:C1A family cysteine protease